MVDSLFYPSTWVSPNRAPSSAGTSKNFRTAPSKTHPEKGPFWDSGEGLRLNNTFEVVKMIGWSGLWSARRLESADRQQLGCKNTEG
jgi:hypothetical protein